MYKKYTILFLALSLKVILINSYQIESIKPFEKKNFNLNEEETYKIYEFYNDKEGTIYVYFKVGNIMSTKVSVYYNEYEININEKTQEVLDYKEQKTLYEKSFLNFYSFNGKMYFVISNFVRELSDEIHIININSYYDITNYDRFQYLYKFSQTVTSYETKYITFSFKNDVKKKNYLHYQLDNFKYSFNDLTVISTKSSKLRIWSESGKIFDISKFKNETINIEFKITSGYAFNSFNLLIYYSDYKNIFVLDPSKPLTLPSIDSKQFFLFIKIFQGTKKLYLNIESMNSIDKNEYYFYETNQIEEVENYLPEYNTPSQGTIIPKLIRNNSYEAQINITQYYYLSIILKVQIKNTANFSVYFYNKTTINLFEKMEFKLNENNRYIIYEYTNNAFLLPNKDTKNANKVSIYFNEKSSDLFQVDIFKNFSDINIDENKGKVKDSILSPKLEESGFIELENINYEKIYIVISNFLNKNSYDNSIQIIKSDNFYDISSKDIFQYNYRFKKSTEKQYLSFKINTEQSKNKYLHFQIYNHKSNQIEDFTFKSLSGEIIKNENNCINLQDNPNKTILMNFGLSSNEAMDNYDIILRQSNYSLIYPFNSSNIIEIPFIRSYSFYIFSNFPEKVKQYTFTINSQQEEIEYFYLDKEEFNEKNINIGNLKANNIKANKENDKMKFTIKKDDEKNKAVIFKININNGINFIINREESESSNSFVTVLLVILAIIIIALIGYYIYKKIYREKNNQKEYKNIINQPIKYDNMLDDLEENNNNINNNITPNISNKNYQTPTNTGNYNNNFINNNDNRQSNRYAPPPSFTDS